MNEPHEGSADPDEGRFEALRYDGSVDSTR